MSNNQMEELDELGMEEYRDEINLSPQQLNGLIVFSRDWTIETIINQLEKGNIDLNPKFQRRNVWDDKKKSRLIESIMFGYPIPEIVLAENPNKPKSFVVIDGKQRLLSIWGFTNGQHWDQPKISGVAYNSPYRDLSYNDITKNNDLLRNFQNSEIRCSVITGFHNTDVLYDIFYRLNAGSVPLSTQELRQSIIIGPYSNFLLDITNKSHPIQCVMNLAGPDDRLRDIEVLLRIMSIIQFGDNYRGNLKLFLDESMRTFNSNWDQKEHEIKQLNESICSAINLLSDIFGDTKLVGRKYKDGSFEKQFNRALFEVEVFFFVHLINEKDLALKSKDLFIRAFQKAYTNNPDFVSSIESSTKNKSSYSIRYSTFHDIFNEVYNKDIKHPFI